MLDRVPLEQFEGTMQDLASSLLQAIGEKAHERGGEAAGKSVCPALFTTRVMGGGRMACPGRLLERSR